MKITLYKTDGTSEVIHDGAYRAVPLEEMYKLIPCQTVERLPLPTDEVEVWINEEGKLTDDWVVNPEATMLFIKAFEGQPTDPFYDWKVAGNALVIERSPEEVKQYHDEEYA